MRRSGRVARGGARTLKYTVRAISGGYGTQESENIGNWKFCLEKISFSPRTRGRCRRNRPDIGRKIAPKRRREGPKRRGTWGRAGRRWSGPEAPPLGRRVRPRRVGFQPPRLGNPQLRICVAHISTRGTFADRESGAEANASGFEIRGPVERRVSFFGGFFLGV